MGRKALGAGCFRRAAAVRPTTEPTYARGKVESAAVEVVVENMRATRRSASERSLRKAKSSASSAKKAIPLNCTKLATASGPILARRETLSGSNCKAPPSSRFAFRRRLMAWRSLTTSPASRYASSSSFLGSGFFCFFFVFFSSSSSSSTPLRRCFSCRLVSEGKKKSWSSISSSLRLRRNSSVLRAARKSPSASFAMSAISPSERPFALSAFATAWRRFSILSSVTAFTSTTSTSFARSSPSKASTASLASDFSVTPSDTTRIAGRSDRVASVRSVARSSSPQ
mmetsp:Transcript_9131/g.29621  ORF Transcript_9131/g.29621 Transcript_9131/m.29621 type:complete len:284 (-) Transcript_9131:485-1336(-)